MNIWPQGTQSTVRGARIAYAQKAKATPHRDAEEAADYPELHLDYGYLCSRNDPGAPHTMGRDTKTNSYVCTMLDCKGRGSHYAIAHLVGWIRGLGHRKVVCRILFQWIA